MRRFLALVGFMALWSIVAGLVRPASPTFAAGHLTGFAAAIVFSVLYDRKAL